MRVLRSLAILLLAAAAPLAAQGGRQQLSPRDTTRLAIGGAQVLVDYGRPSKRGRVIFGELVPWDQVWRTGANQATHLRTDRDLAFGTTVVPAGTYTLYTIPRRDGWTLLINTQTGQWGTTHDPARDQFRLEMRTATLPQPEERFTVLLTPEPGGRGAKLSLRWDATEASIPFTVR